MKTGGSRKFFSILKSGLVDNSSRLILHRVPSGHEHVSTRGAATRSRHSAVKINSFMAESIYIWRWHFRLSVVDSKVSDAQIIRDHQNHIRLPGFNSVRKKEKIREELHFQNKIK